MKTNVDFRLCTWLSFGTILQYIAQVVNDFALTILTYEVFFQSQI